MADRTYNITFDVNTDEVSAGVDKATKATKDLGGAMQDVKGKSVDATKAAQGGLTDLSSTANSVTGGLFSGFTRGYEAIKKGVLGLQVFKSALISTGIGALVVAAGALFAAFQRIQGVQDAFKAGSAALRTVLDRLSDVAASLGQWLIAAFQNPQQAIKDLWEFIKENVVNRFEGIIDQARALGRVLQAAFTLDFDELTAGLEDYGNALIKTTTGVEDAIGKMREFGGEMAAAAKAAYDLTQAEHALKDATMANTVVQAENNREIARNRLIAADVTKSIEERRVALEESLKLEQANMEAAVALAAEELRIQQQRMSLSNSLREDYQKEAELKAKLIGLETASLEGSRRMVSQLSGFNAQIAAENEALAQKRREAAQKRTEDLASIEAALFEATATEFQKTERATEEKYDALIKLAKKYGRDTADIEAQREAAIAAQIAAELALVQEALDKEAEIRAAAQEEIDALVDARELSAEEAERERVAAQFQSAMALAEEQGISTLALKEKLEQNMLAITEKYEKLGAAAVQKAEKEKAAARRAAAKQSIDMASAALTSVGQLLQAAAGDDEARARRAFEISKGLRIAETLMTGAAAAVAAIGPPPSGFGPTPAGFVAAGTASATTLAQVLAIRNTAFGGGGAPVAASGGGAALAGGPSATAAPIPTFQLPDQPADADQMRAYVVDEELNTTAARNRRIEELAKF